MKKNYKQRIALLIIAGLAYLNVNAQTQWNFSTGMDGWSLKTSTGWSHPDSSICITNAQITSGSLKIDFTCGDPYFYSPIINKDASNNFVKVKMKNQSSSVKGQIFFISNDNPMWINSNNTYVEFPTSSKDTAFKEYTVDMSVHPAWTGNIIELRLDPANDADSSTVLIESVELTSKNVAINNLLINNNVLNIYPNPARDKINIQNLISGNQEIIITDLLGKIVLNYNVKSNALTSQTIDVSSLRRGVYFIKIINNEKCMTKKFLKI